MRQKLLNALLIASFGAMAATAGAQTATPTDNNTPKNAPVGGTAAAPAMGSGGTMAPSMPIDKNMPTDMKGYKAGRAACDKEAAGTQERCRTTLNARYISVAPKCQKLSGSALDDCLKGSDTAN
jgi:hypothetical protein